MRPQAISSALFDHFSQEILHIGLTKTENHLCHLSLLYIVKTTSYLSMWMILSCPKMILIAKGQKSIAQSVLV